MARRRVATACPRAEIDLYRVGTVGISHSSLRSANLSPPHRSFPIIIAPMTEHQDQPPDTNPVANNEPTEINAQTPQPPQQPLSKNALKKAAKQERWQAAKLERRAREKEAKKQKKKLLAAKRAAGELDENDEEQKRSAKRRKVEFGGRVVVDLGFDELMNEKEIKSLTSQLAYTYSANRNADFPFSLLFTSLNGRTYERLESLGDASYKRWTKSEWWTDGFERLWEGQPAAGSSAVPTSTGHDDTEAGPTTSESTVPVGSQPTADEIRQKVVYLTADCEEELTELKPDETYIIGGICDHNRYKNLCLNKAQKHGVRTAKLPIGRYLSNLPTRKVLTVNQCFEILLKWVETRDWEEALYSVIPKRKFQAGEKGNDAKDSKVVVVAADVEDEAMTGEGDVKAAVVTGAPAVAVEGEGGASAEVDNKA
ncbi:tRNA (guanine-N(1)-)-methyltransferase [Coprinopsis cinerea okayama7|uniref:tRNA (guanine(9)-N1)-methyltransferase n=1 Tax=Coprinopsis cinerea (strain Okayama-7 / 130 / ATCC MYA-4618 / FGSC 9003) TaxID=240176 RepID=A8NYP9_COPC7|nr:tRNA (guanine-N(1)-)-methyltransferase [Coprinopsis cinerea okayama7\|eukprot:XP_001837488.2 tRNA (guanine-N(1)-)-methyltransferase [Coprinopsis cinerea okayama7\